MKIEIMMKDPDGTSSTSASTASSSEFANPIRDSRSASRSASSRPSEKAKKVLAKWFDHEEYVTVIVDTEAGTAIVKERAR